MGSYINFKNFNDTLQPEVNGVKAPVGNFPLAQQSSIFSWTFDEFQSNLGGHGKDFGSMNMDELLKNIWTVDETPGGNLQRQGSLTLPRTLSQKTVDEVWKDLFKESYGARDASASGNGDSSFQQRQQTLGEMTLEEFLVKAGVVTEDLPQPIPTNGGFCSEIQPPPSNHNTGFTFGFQPSARNIGVLANQTAQNNSLVPNQSPGSAQNVSFASPMHLVNNTRPADPAMKNGSVQGGVVQNGAMSMAGLSSVATNIKARSPVNQLSADVTAKSNFSTSSLSPIPYMFGEGVRGRKSGGGLEKVQERRHKRMIKNRESAARSRARKQAYTLELEAEIAQLKEVNEELQKRQAEILELQKNQIAEATKKPWGSKRQCLRRTFTGPW